MGQVALYASLTALLGLVLVLIGVIALAVAFVACWRRLRYLEREAVIEVALEEERDIHGNVIKQELVYTKGAERDEQRGRRTTPPEPVKETATALDGPRWR